MRAAHLAALKDAVGIGGKAAVGEEHRFDALPELFVRQEEKARSPLRRRCLGHALSSLRSFAFGSQYVSLVDIPRAKHRFAPSAIFGLGARLRIRNLDREARMSGGYDDRDGKIWLDGQLVEWRDAQVHVLTHALHYASSVFEGERCYDGRIFKGVEHSQRLRKSAELLDFEIPYSVEGIETAKYAVLEANGWSNAYVRALAWRGAGPDMGVASLRNPVRMAVAAWEWGSYYGDAKMKGAKLDIAKWKRPSPETAPSQAKAAGLYMICTMSKHAAEAKGCSDALMFDYRGYVAERTGANMFFVKDGEVHTPLADCFLNGITRQTVIAMLKDKGLTVHERHIMPEELEGFEQCWLTGTAAEVTPVGQIGDYSFEVGALTRDVAESYEKLVRA
ncbi:LOW QUALITY PROTEIN: branched-chain amino acid aminotransferase [Limimaricola cinnabarinus LL-001]|uniref:Branched-chain-amino-acid aminotransferase n=1 Tax=Limimaricola cinnabarinus LL-001 TaxID=1337093 RepID=U3AAQ9_9RHOB|nr:LOW QUALITY PROTEIN: branched-chain amino acid aminotransferase [Limimaricola cinnabarinus LL-001]